MKNYRFTIHQLLMIIFIGLICWSMHSHASYYIPPGGVTTSKIADSAVTTAKINALAVTTAKIDANAVTVPKLAAGTTNSNDLTNCALAVAKSGNTMIISFKNQAGNDPSSSDPCQIGFRSATATVGTYSNAQVTAATSLTISDTSTLGCVIGVSCVIDVYAVNNAGTPVVGVRNGPLIDEGSVATGTAEGGAGAADSMNTLYTAASQASKAVRYFGRYKAVLQASSHWSVDPTEISPGPTARGGLENGGFSAMKIRWAQLNCDSGASVTSQGNGTWVVVNTNVSAGGCSWTISTGVFANTPHCFISSSLTGAVNPQILGMGNISATSFDTDCDNDAGGDCTVYDPYVMCIGN